MHEIFIQAADPEEAQEWANDLADNGISVIREPDGYDNFTVMADTVEEVTDLLPPGTYIDDNFVLAA